MLRCLLVNGSVNFGGNHTLFAASCEDSAQKVLAVTVLPDNFFSDIALWNLQVISGVAGVIHQGQEAVVNVEQLEVPTFDVRHLHVVGGWANIFELLSCEDVQSHHVDFGVTVLAGLGG